MRALDREVPPNNTWNCGDKQRRSRVEDGSGGLHQGTRRNGWNDFERELATRWTPGPPLRVEGHEITFVGNWRHINKKWTWLELIVLCVSQRRDWHDLHPQRPLWTLKVPPDAKRVSVTLVRWGTNVVGLKLSWGSYLDVIGKGLVTVQLVWKWHHRLDPAGTLKRSASGTFCV